MSGAVTGGRDMLEELSANADGLTRREDAFLKAALASVAMAAVSPALLSLVADASRGYLVLMPLAAVGGGLLFLAIQAGRKAEMVRSEIAALVNARYRDTRWKTKAGVVGVVMEAQSRGKLLRLAFASGAVETYDRDMLEPMPVTAAEGE